MAATPAQFIEQMLPALYAQTAKMTFYIDEIAEPMTDAGFFGTKYNYAVALRAMHTYTIDTNRPKGEAGLVTGLAEGSASIRYWNKVEKGRYSDLQMTHWGQRLLALIKSRGGTISVSADPTGALADRVGE